MELGRRGGSLHRTVPTRLPASTIRSRMLQDKLTPLKERIASAPRLEGVRRLSKHGQRSLKQWQLRRRRARASKRRGTSRKSLYFLISTFLLLMGLFAWALAYTKASPVGQRLTVDQVS